MRWTAHCVLGTILRFHGADHSPWRFDNATQGVIRSYLRMRYALAPSLISAGRTTQRNGLPLAARCDLFWPNYTSARRNDQYISTFADALVAPLAETQTNRSVWVPPGVWEDAWDGTSLTGPRTIQVTQPFSRIPMWHRRGSVVITTDSTALRVQEQDWHRLTIEAWPAAAATSSARDLYLGDSHVSVALSSDGRGGVQLHVRRSGDDDPRALAWLLRLHLAPNEKLSDAFFDGGPVQVRHLEVAQKCADGPINFPFLRSAPACGAGPVAEIEIQEARPASGWHLRAKAVADLPPEGPPGGG